MLQSCVNVVVVVIVVVVVVIVVVVVVVGLRFSLCWDGLSVIFLFFKRLVINRSSYLYTHSLSLSLFLSLSLSLSLSLIVSGSQHTADIFLTSTINLNVCTLVDDKNPKKNYDAVFWKVKCCPV